MTADVQDVLSEVAPPADAACRHLGCVHQPTEDVCTLASVVTLVRVVGCLALTMASIATGHEALLLAGLAVHCIGDIADGAIARRRTEETRAGAVLDIVGDRLCIAVYYVSFGQLHHDLLLPVALFLFTFMVLDAHLSLTFLSWPLMSLNYFGTVDRGLYRWNWSPLAKGCHGGLLPALMLTTRSATLCTAVAVGLLAVKAASLVRLLGRGVPAPAGCAAAVTS